MTTCMIQPAELRKLCASGVPVALLDVRDPVEADRSHIPDMTNLPRNRIEFRVAQLVPDRSTALVLYCDGESGRSVLAAKTLARLGYDNIQVLAGGLKGWVADGGTVYSGNNVPSKRFGEVVHHDNSVPSIEASALDDLIRNGSNIAIRDIRTPGEHADACVPQGISMPSFDIALHAHDLARDHDLVVLHCAGRTRGIIATQTLREMGLDNVVVLENGTIGWHLAGLQLWQGAPVSESPDPSAESVAYAEDAAAKMAQGAGVNRITSSELQDLLAREGVNRYVFDVRGVHDYVQGHIPGSLALPGGQAVQRMDDFIVLRNAPIVLIGQGEATANLTATWLKRMGCTDVSVLEGGLERWVSEGGRLDKGRGNASPLGWQQVQSAARMISAEDLNRLLHDNQGVHLIDVDHSANFRKVRVAGASWLPRAWLELRINESVPERDATIVLVSADGKQACYAAFTLNEMGYADVRVLDGGNRAWASKGLPVEQNGIKHQDDELLPPYKRGVQAMHDYIHWEKQLVR